MYLYSTDVFYREKDKKPDDPYLADQIVYIDGSKDTINFIDLDTSGLMKE